METEQAIPPLAPGTRILDVRPQLRAGAEPFSDIMAALKSLAPGQGLAIRAIFEPRPLFGLFAARGFKGESHQLAEDDWLIDFQPAPGASAAEGFEQIDVRGLEPPEPLVRILARCQALEDGRTLKVLHERRPEMLYARLEDLGLLHRTEVLAEDRVDIYITRPGKHGA